MVAGGSVIIVVEVDQIDSIGESVLFVVGIAAVGSGFAFAFVFGFTDRSPDTKNGRSVLFIGGIAVVGFGFVTDSFAGAQDGWSALLIVGIAVDSSRFTSVTQVIEYASGKDHHPAVASCC